MSAGLQSKIPFYQDQPGRLAPIAAHANLSHSSEGLGWQGAHLEVGSIVGFLLEDISVEGVLLGMNLRDGPMQVERREQGQWVNQAYPPRGMWLYPEGEPLSFRHGGRTDWVLIAIDGAYLDTVMGDHYEVMARHLIVDPLLENLVLSLVNLVKSEQAAIRNDPALAKSLIDAMITTMVRIHGRRSRAFRSGGIAPHHLKQLLQWVDANLDSDLTVELMAERVGLSTAHFSREFKRSTGSTPWSHVIDQRLHRALELIRQGEKAREVATLLRFYDLPHLCRAMRTRFGGSPNELLRRS